MMSQPFLFTHEYVMYVGTKRLWEEMVWDETTRSHSHDICANSQSKVKVVYALLLQTKEGNQPATCHRKKEFVS